MQHMHDTPAVFCWAGIPTLVLLTKIDEYDPAVIVTDIKRTFHSICLRNLITVGACMLAPQQQHVAQPQLSTMFLSCLFTSL